MFTILKDSEKKIIEMLNQIRYEAGPYYALLFNFSKLALENSSEYQLKIAINVVSDLFKINDGGIFLLKDGDIVIIYQGEDKILIDKAIFQLRYFFADDKLAFITEGYENPAFNTIFALKYQWQEFSNYCQTKLSPDIIPVSELSNEREITEDLSLVELINTINNTEFRPLIRWQDICFVPNDGNRVKILYQEVYVSISHFKEQINHKFHDFFNNKKLFLYITEKLDINIMKLLQNHALIPNNATMSINLNISTILSEEFIRFDKYIKANRTLSMVVEIDILDVFTDISAFKAAKELLHNLNYRICLDGVTYFSFMQIDREILGVDLIKLQWNLDKVATLTNNENIKLLEMVKKCGANRIILSRCDNNDAVRYGHALGISLFQGWHLDKLISNKT